MSMREVGRCCNDPCRQLDLLWEDGYCSDGCREQATGCEVARLHLCWLLRHDHPRDQPPTRGGAA